MHFPPRLCLVLLSLSVPGFGPSGSALAITPSDSRFDGRGFRVLNVNLKADDLRVVYRHPIV